MLQPASGGLACREGGRCKACGEGNRPWGARPRRLVMASEVPRLGEARLAGSLRPTGKRSPSSRRGGDRHSSVAQASRGSGRDPLGHFMLNSETTISVIVPVSLTPLMGQLLSDKIGTQSPVSPPSVTCRWGLQGQLSSPRRPQEMDCCPQPTDG